MIKFLKRVFLFAILAVLLGEAIIRIFNLTVDVPKTYASENGLIRYYPDQEGNFMGGSHKWKINKFGYSGNEPESFKNLITLLGDSYIENFMNPMECHQDVYLKQVLPQYNYFEASRSGATVLELLETAKYLDTLSPKLHVLYVKNNDFTESIKSLTKDNNFVRYDIEKNKLLNAKYRGSMLKDILYNFKFAYYVYRNIILQEDDAATAVQPFKEKHDNKTIGKIKDLMQFIKTNYTTHNKIMVFIPNSDPEIMKLCEDAGFKVFELDDSKDEKVWRLENDPHWSCYGHERVAGQVKGFIEKAISNKP